MKKILVLKTANDNTMQLWLNEHGTEDNEVHCMIQSSQLKRYKEKYPYVSFIDIESEGFYELSESAMKQVLAHHYQEVYVTLSGVVGHNYGNVMEIIRQLSFDEGFFYNCNGEKKKMLKMNSICESLCRFYIKCIERIYR